MALNPNSRAEFNLRNTNILLVETGTLGMQILVQILVGFGAKTFEKCSAIAAAQELVRRTEFDLMIVDAILGDEDGYELVEWIRAEAPTPNRFAPLLMISAHTQSSKVAKARDSGAHFIIGKPLTPTVLLERILWIAREQRPFIAADEYAGPDRRFKFEGPPPKTKGRRHDDLSHDVGEATQPNMSQEQINALMQPRKVSV
jgi:DNA-binding response OmpR family regulator